MPWVKFTRADQARPGAKMRLRSTLRSAGRPTELTVVERKTLPYQGTLIYFDDGTSISLADARRNPDWQVRSNADDKD